MITLQEAQELEKYTDEELKKLNEGQNPSSQSNNSRGKL